MTEINCPSCPHPINDHSGAIGRRLAAGCHGPRSQEGKPCPCTLTPNHIAYHHLFGELTPKPAGLRPGARPLGAWE
jgi:hypothetical protein